MVKPTASLDGFWSSLIVEELIRQNCNYFCISPGSRSTPLTVAVAKNEKAISKIFYDERGAAYHALGYSKATGNPAVLICTSGTAAANYYPAIIEARQDSIPLIVLTADRPHELRATGANQTIDQVKMFGDYVNWFFELPAPDANVSPQFVLTTIDQAVAKSLSPGKGAVHINCMFREPFFSENKIIVNDSIKNWEKSGEAFTTYNRQTLKIIPNQDIIKKINSATHGIIFAGKMENQSDSRAVLRLAKQLNWLVFADITSGIRMTQSELIVEHFDLALLSSSFKVSLNPEVILQFGKRFISKRLLNFLAEFKPDNYFLIDESPDRLDPVHIVSDRIVAGIDQFCESLLQDIAISDNKPWYEKILAANTKIQNLVEKEFSNDKISEISTARLISKHIPKNSGLYLASSMPVREMDMFAAAEKSNIRVAANRGASGIDGTIASAIGFAEGIQSAVTLVIGDLAFIHDLNSLYQLTSSNYPVFIVVLNNSGGGIFSFLPISNQQDVFEKYFATPHNLTFENAAKMFDLNIYNPKSNSDFINCYCDMTERNQSSIIEIKIDREDNYNLHQHFYQKIINLLEK